MSIPAPWLPWLQLIRAANLFTALSNILAAWLIATQGRSHFGEFLCLAGASLLLYAGGMVLNDCFDLAEDRRERPQRPLPAGKIAINRAWGAGFGLLGAGVVLALGAGLASGLIALVLALAILAYDGVTKGGPSGPPVMGLCRYLNWLLGLSVNGLILPDLALALPILLYVAGLTWLSGVETTAARRRPLVLCALGVTGAGLIILVLHGTGLLPGPWLPLGVAAGLGLILYRLWVLHRDFTPAHIQAAIMTLVMGIIPLDALLVAGGGPSWGVLAVLVLMVPGRALARILYVT